MTDRLSAADAAFLYLEGPDVPVHGGALATFRGDPPPLDEVVGTVVARLDRVPRLRQRPAFVPLGRPVWVDDAHFDPGYHVRQATVPSDLEDTVAHLMEGHLDRARPLWELWLLTPPDGGTFALLLKLHPVDGLAPVAVLDTLLHPSADEPVGWTPEPEPTSARLLLEAVAQRLTEPLRIVRGATGALRHPSRLAHAAGEVGRASVAVAMAARRPAPPSPLDGVPGPNRSCATVALRVRDVDAVRASLGGTTPDVVLAVMSEAISRWMIRRGMDVRRLELKAMVPDASGAATIAPLPVREADPLKRYAIVRRATRHARWLHPETAGRLLIELAGIAPLGVFARFARVQPVERLFNLVVADAGAARGELDLLGRRMSALYPLVPPMGHATLTVAFAAGADVVGIGLLADAEAVGDIDVLARGFREATRELVAAARQPALRRSLPAHGDDSKARSAGEAG